MTSKQFNARYRPLVKRAWLQHCERSGTSPNCKPAYDLWYQQTLHEMSGGRLHSTKGAHDKELRHLIEQFELAVNEDRIPIYGWSFAQVDRFHDLAKAAWIIAAENGSDDAFIPWVGQLLHRHHRQVIDGYWYMPNRKLSFDTIMADLAIQANDEYWIRRTAEQGEIRLRYQIQRFLTDLDYLDKTGRHDWDYVKGIYKQAEMLPRTIDDAPAETLWKVLQMLDTHIRRLCKDYDIRPMNLPTRSRPHAEPIAIREGNHHLHVGHELEHVNSPIHAHAEEHAHAPF